MSVSRMAPAIDAALDCPHSTVARRVVDAYLFFRLSVLGFTCLLPIWGVLTVSATPPAGQLFGCLVLALAFHIYAYVGNDVVDLAIDARDPERADFPLVRGTISARVATAVALVQIPLALIAAWWLGAGVAGCAALTLGFVGLGIYNLWGKRCFVPPLTDLVQGLGWVGLLLCGALLAGAPNARTALAAIAVVAYVLVVSALHGGLRDLVNDVACNVRTTPIFFGARATSGELMSIPATLTGYGIGLQILMFACVLLLFQPALSYQLPLLRISMLFVALAGIVASWVLMFLAYRWRADGGRVLSLATWHLFICMALPGLPLISTEGSSATIMALTFGLPVAATAAYRRTR